MYISNTHVTFIHSSSKFLLITFYQAGLLLKTIISECWRDGSVVNISDCSCRGSNLCFQHTHDILQPICNYFSRISNAIFWLLWALCILVMHRYICSKNNHICEKKEINKAVNCISGLLLWSLTV